YLLLPERSFQPQFNLFADRAARGDSGCLQTFAHLTPAPEREVHGLAVFIRLGRAPDPLLGNHPVRSHSCTSYHVQKALTSRNEKGTHSYRTYLSVQKGTVNANRQ